MRDDDGRFAQQRVALLSTSMSTASRAPAPLRKYLAVAQDLLFNPKSFWYLAALVVLGDTFLTGIIIRYVPC